MVDFFFFVFNFGGCHDFHIYIVNGFSIYTLIWTISTIWLCFYSFCFSWLNVLSPNIIKGGSSDLKAMTCWQLTFLRCDAEMKHRKWLKHCRFLQSREEEMGDRVWQVQKELEELQAKSHGTSEVQTFLTHSLYIFHRSSAVWWLMSQPGLISEALFPFPTRQM